MTTNDHALAGERILLLEDDRFTSVYLVAAIESAGAHVLGPHACETMALDAGWQSDARPTAAIISAHPPEGFCADLAARLHDEAVPHVFVSARPGATLPADWGHCTVISKPYASYQVVEAIAAMLAERAETPMQRTAAAV